MPDYTDLLYEVSDGVAKLTLNRPDRMNAISGPMLASISEALRNAAAFERSLPSIDEWIPITYARHPFRMAQQALTVQAATGGRLTLGIGPSHRPLIDGMWGLSYDRVAGSPGRTGWAGDRT